MRSLVVLSALCLAACGEAVNKPDPSALEATAKAATPIAEQPAEIVRPKPPELAAVGALDRPAALRHFFDALVRLEAGDAQEDVKILQFGDSHTAADIETGAVRRALQARFGDGGRGFVAIGRPWKQWYQDGVHVGMSSEWSPQKAKLEHGKWLGDGLYGLAGVGLFTRQHGARAWTDVAARTARAELAYLEQPTGGSFEVLVDGVKVVRVGTKSERTGSAFRTFDVADAAAHQLEVRALGDGDVRVFGLSLDRAEHGIVLDALGINGARVTSSLLTWSEPHWAEQLRHRNPSLVVFAYGTNESTDLDLAPATYERQLVDALGRLARAAPRASCLLLGPPDRAVGSKDAGYVTAPKILEIIAVQRRVAAAGGCAFYDQLAAMGGPGTIATWALEDPPRAQKDRVHLTREGYAQLGTSIASELMRAYAGYRRELGLPPSTTREVPVSTSTLPATPDLTETP